MSEERRTEATSSFDRRDPRDDDWDESDVAPGQPPDQSDEGSSEEHQSADPYELLQVERSATAEEVRRAYFRLVRLYPPETHPDEFKQIRAAYETLRSPMRRAELALESYDETAAAIDLDILAPLASPGGTGSLDLAAILLAVELSASDLGRTEFPEDLTPIDEANLAFRDSRSETEPGAPDPALEAGNQEWVFRRIFGSAAPPPSAEPPRLLVELVADRGRLEQELAAGQEAVRSELAAASSAIQDDLVQARAALAEQIEGVAREVGKLGREQLQVGTVLEGQGEQIEGQAEQLNEITGSWREHLSLRERELAELRHLLAERDAHLRLDLIQHLIPVADALAESVRSARELIASLQAEGTRREGTSSARSVFHRIAQARLALAGASRVASNSAPVASLAPHAPEELTAWLDGLLLTERRLLALLEREDVRPIPSVGQQFDPQRHLAVDVERRADVPDGMVVGETLRGYKRGGQVLRPAEVIVVRAAAGYGADQTRANLAAEEERPGLARMEWATESPAHGPENGLAIAPANCLKID